MRGQSCADRDICELIVRKLRRERELRGISLKQISDDTKIGVRFLEALEEDRLDLIPGDVITYYIVVADKGFSCSFYILLVVENRQQVT